MLSEKYMNMLSEKDIIFEIAGYGKERMKEIGAENVFDFSLGNPSVSAPKIVNKSIEYIINNNNSLDVHGYGPSAGIPSVRNKIAESLNRRFEMRYSLNNIFITLGAVLWLMH